MSDKDFPWTSEVRRWIAAIFAETYINVSMAPYGNKKRRVFLDIIIASCLSITMFEVIAAICNYPRNGVQRKPFPGAFTDDPIVGWKHKPGTYRYIEDNKGSPRAFEVTFREDGARFSGAALNFGRPLVGLLGCSFVEGFGLDNNAALGAQLQKRLPMYSVENFGVSGYGTYQSLLTFRTIADRYGQMPRSVVVYGFADFHAHRNVVSPLLQRTFQDNGTFPVCDEERCFSWGGKRMDGVWRMSRTFSLVENALDSILVRRKREHAERVTKKILVELRDETAARGARLVIAPVTSVSATWRDFFTQNSFQVASCFVPDSNDREFRLSDGHPNALWIERYSVCLGDFIIGAPDR